MLINYPVAPLAGAWIEILAGIKIFPANVSACLSHPSRVRGLKFIILIIIVCYLVVAPFAGAWIEIICGQHNRVNWRVAPFAGAWIEIPLTMIGT